MKLVALSVGGPRGVGEPPRERSHWPRLAALLNLKNQGE